MHDSAHTIEAPGHRPGWPMTVTVEAQPERGLARIDVHFMDLNAGLALGRKEIDRMIVALRLARLALGEG